MRDLYPALEPFSTEMLDVGDGHTVYVERCGNPDGLPAVFLHGGPGSGCKPDHRQFFDPRRYHVVLFDQRGSGRSRPYGGVEHNTTQHLLADMETIRGRYGIERWVLFGGSWGAALALAYAERHSERVSALLLRGSFLARRRDVDWFFGGGANRLLPEQWQRFVDDLGLADVDDLPRALYEGIFSGDDKRVRAVAAAWERWSGAVVMFSIDELAGGANGPEEAAIAKARLEMHYARNGYFIEEGELVARLDQLPAVPTRIIHGARDLTCPAESAWLLQRAIPGATLELLRTAGHLSSERPMIDALVRATDAMADRLGKT
ncbi:MAG: prolyl aminopeptidase [Gammaproteobacteria bacterium]